MNFGGYDAAFADDAVFCLDGGAMFGIVPRPVWERLIPPDAKNRIDMALHVLVLRGNGRVILIETGIGDKIGPKGVEQMNIRRGGGAPAALRAMGVAPGDVTDVILSHLHFDHAGGTTLAGPDGPVPAYPNARVWVQKAQWERAISPSIRERGSFMKDDYELLRESENLRLIEGSYKVAPAVRVYAVNGHTPGMQVVTVGDGPGSLLYLADLVPTAGHVRLPYVMGYDIEPLVTVEEKRRWLTHAIEQRSVTVFGHDLAVPACLLARGRDGEAMVAEKVTI
jgi:glyoxylase-like metal-dependent hydrolase (beta-lactamase superfamily II)